MNASLRRICLDLGLPEGDSFTQNWAYELPEQFRDKYHFFRYVDAYSDASYEDPERHLLMELMLDVVNDLLQQDEPAGIDAWASLIRILHKNPHLHRDQLECWAADGEKLEDAFSLTPLARQLLQEFDS